MPLLGVPLIEHVITIASAGGVSDFVVVVGYHGDQVKAKLEEFARRTQTPIRFVENDRWDQPNGLSVLAARGAVDGPFFLLMSDHLFDPTILEDMVELVARPDGVTLAVDFDVGNPTVDMEDVTRVNVGKGLIQKLGKGLTPYNGFDTGIFLCSPILFDAIDESSAHRGDLSLSGGMNVLAASMKANAFDVSGRFWLDVDDPRSADLAERVLRTRSSEGTFQGSGTAETSRPR